MSKLPLEQRANRHHFQIYGGLVCAAVLLFVIRAVLLFETLVSSSKRLHDKMTIAILKASVLFFDTNPVGRIMNRFSSDMAIVDELFPYVFVDMVQLVLYSAASVMFACALNVWIIFAVVPLLMVFFRVARLYNKTFRELRRLEALNRSPLFSHFSDTLEGLATIRAYNKEAGFLQELYRFEAYFTSVACVLSFTFHNNLSNLERNRSQEDDIRIDLPKRAETFKNKDFLWTSSPTKVIVINLNKSTHPLLYHKEKTS